AFELLNARDLLNALQFRDAPTRMRLEFLDAEGQLVGGGEVQEALVNQGLWEFEYPPFLAEIRRPVFVISGAHDRTSYPEQVQWVADLADADVTVLDAAHYPWLDDEDAFAQALEDALTR
ncbi:alpha/beta fold hydrolase, partial [Deinococcus sp. 23YEL01]|nr:alpha/beta hydrolase [Deinococcus sp. 23YEL01]